MNQQPVLEAIQNAEMLLIGLGEEFDNVKSLSRISGYDEERKALGDFGAEWMIPALNYMYLQDNNKENGIYGELRKFAKLIENKNYFVIATSTNDVIREIPWRQERLVMPCGGSFLKQCSKGCGQEPSKTLDCDWERMRQYRMERKWDLIQNLGVCPGCGSPLILNNVYTENYDEKGYLEQWKSYTNWLQGTLNKRLLILELGVGMQCPTVIRWPFEKIAFYNQKAVFYRVHEKLFQISEQLKEKSTGVGENAVAWLQTLCDEGSFKADSDTKLQRG